MRAPCRATVGETDCGVIREVRRAAELNPSGARTRAHSVARQTEPGRGGQKEEAVVAPLAAGPSLSLSLPVSNPARGAVAFALRLGQAGPLRVSVFDLQGRRVRTLWNGPAPAGESRIIWDTRDEGGTSVAPGLYLARAQDNGLTSVRRMCVLN